MSKETSDEIDWEAARESKENEMMRTNRKVSLFIGVRVVSKYIKILILTFVWTFNIFYWKLRQSIPSTLGHITKFH